MKIKSVEIKGGFMVWKWILLLATLSALSVYAKPLKVQVYCEGKETIDNLIVGYLGRELRGLGDVDVSMRIPKTLEEAQAASNEISDYKLTVQDLEITSGGKHSGFAVSLTITTAHICNNSETFMQNYISTTSDSNLEAQCKSLIAQIDADWLEIIRKHNAKIQQK